MKFFLFSINVLALLFILPNCNLIHMNFTWENLYLPDIYPSVHDNPSISVIADSKVEENVAVFLCANKYPLENINNDELCKLLSITIIDLKKKNYLLMKKLDFSSAITHLSPIDQNCFYSSKILQISTNYLIFFLSLSKIR